ncbi:hypothetical protein PTI98_005562 [Pleurotus ostreatus]|nr:hypothetical protein PTI98_005562 [Pleurotus ostreatus]
MDNTLQTSAVAIMEVGTTLSTFLFGISSLQAYTYYLRFPKDRPRLKTLALGVWAMELGHMVAILHYFYTLSIFQFGRIDFMEQRAPPSLSVAAFLDGFLAVLVSGFFIHRVQKLTGNNALVAFCILLSFLRLVGVIAIATVGSLQTQNEFLAQRKWMVITTASIGAANDILIAGALSFNLYHRKKDHADISVSERTLKLLDKLIVDTLRTGLVSSVLSASLALFLIFMTDNLVWIAIFVCQARAFTNSFFGTLNGRASFRSSRLAIRKSNPLHSIHFANTVASSSQSASARLTFLSTVPEDNHVSRGRANTFNGSRA